MSSELLQALAAPFRPDQVSWRVGSVKKDGTAAMALAFIDARDVMDRLDAVCGPAGWQNRYTHAEKKTVCELGVKIDGEWVWKADGAGESDIEAEKGALSDAFKRAAVRWGVGRYLYHLPSPWVKIDQYKKILPEEMSRLEALLGREARANPPPRIPVEERGLFNACKAAIDLCEGKASLESWAKDNTTSMGRIEHEDPEVYAAVRRYYAGKLKLFSTASGEREAA